MVAFKPVDQTLCQSQKTSFFSSFFPPAASVSYKSTRGLSLSESVGWYKPNAKHICNILSFPVYLLKVQILLCWCSADAKGVFVLKRWFHVTGVCVCVCASEPEHLNPPQGFKGQKLSGCAHPILQPQTVHIFANGFLCIVYIFALT